MSGVACRAADDDGQGNCRWNLARMAADFASVGADETEAVIDSLSAEAIRRWWLQEATFWQQVRFRARMIRATRDGADKATLKGGIAC